MGGDDAPAAVLAGALLAVSRDAELEVVLVGPPELAPDLPDRVTVVAASEVVGMDEEPARAVRAKRDATVRVIHRLVRDGEADAAVSIGSTGAVLTAAVLTLGRLTPRPAVAVIVPALAGPLVLLDAGASSDCTAEQLLSHAQLGAAYAEVALGLTDPAVGLLSVGSEPGKGDQLRRDAYLLLEGSALRFVGNVEGYDVPLGGKADVVVTDGFTGNVLLKGMEGADARAGGGGLPVSAVLLGVDGVSVVGHGFSDPEAVAGCLEHAARVVREGLMARLRERLTVREVAS
jgi:glycerol-3-phosphate acyltransferase PlsX